MWKLLRPDAIAVLKDEKACKSLARYFSVMQNEKPAKFMITKKIPAQFNANESAEELWQKHAELTQEFYETQRKVDTERKILQDMSTPEKSYLDLKIEIARRTLFDCHFCARRCGINRIQGELGFCKCGTEISVSSIFEHVGEEPELVPSGTIFTMGCTMRCKHCQNWTISQWIEKGKVYGLKELANEVEHLRANSCRNVNLVGGEPTPWLWQWLETFKYVNANIPIVWNSNSYYSPETAQLLAGFADVYLLDFKYGSQGCAEKISGAPNYWKVCTYNHLEAKKYGDLLIRVLVLPDHLECCVQPIVNWIAANLGTGTRVNLMFQYRPEWLAYEIPELRRRLTRDEIERAVQLARKAKLANFIT
ncbi:MAG: radical SAM protein [Candidatus Bathyarchaeota archaeon]|nr:radical SAM protein [Candidatus Bathyarchaeota archaeon]